jgi:hypothetical protein
MTTSAPHPEVLTSPATAPTVSGRLGTFGVLFAAVGAACVVAGGLTAAVSATAPSEHGAWAAAYLVLVCGVAQIALGAGQPLLGHPARRLLAWEFAAWNLGNAGVLAGTLAGSTTVVDAGGVLLAAALALMAFGTRKTSASRVWALRGYRVLTALVLVSIPVGLVLAATGSR